MRTIVDELKGLIECFPLVFQYFVPGIWCIILFKFSFGKKINENYLLPLSCILSFILLSFTKFLLEHEWFAIVPDNVYVNSFICVIIGSLITISLSIASNFQWFKKLNVFIFHKTINDSIWDDVIDYENGSNLRIHLKDKDYYIIGHHQNHESNTDDPWIAISGFGIFDISTDDELRSYITTNDDSAEMKNKKENTIMVIRFSDIEHIEVFN